MVEKRILVYLSTQVRGPLPWVSYIHPSAGDDRKDVFDLEHSLFANRERSFNCQPLGHVESSCPYSYSGFAAWLVETFRAVSMDGQGSSPNLGLK
jgi:hypothetical protein